MRSSTTAQSSSLAFRELQSGARKSHFNNPARNEITDENLLHQLADGHLEALENLFRRYARVARFVGRRILRDPAEADDFVQDLFLYIYRKCEVYDAKKGPASSWIVQMIYYQALQRRSQLTERQRILWSLKGDFDDTGFSNSSSEYEQSLEGMIGRVKLREMVRSLSDDQWDALRLHFFEGYTLSEIAQKKRQSLGNIRHHFYRGLEKLRSSVFRSELKDRISSGKK